MRRPASYVSEHYVLCEVDFVTLKGKHAPVPIYAPLAERGMASAEQQVCAARYRAALELYRRGTSTEAALIWDDITRTSTAGGLCAVSQVMALHAGQDKGK
jgi:hypothetical protein